MELADVVALAQRFWVVWLLALFVGILVWVFRPGRKKDMERFGRIPLEDDALEGQNGSAIGDGGGRDVRGQSGGKGE